MEVKQKVRKSLQFFVVRIFSIFKYIFPLADFFDNLSDSTLGNRKRGRERARERERERKRERGREREGVRERELKRERQFIL